MSKRFKKSINKLKQIDRWGNIGVHQSMIQDKLRTSSYKKAIENNVKNNDIVLDIGCGTAILSFFAAKKGCKKIYAIDKSSIINRAKEIAKLNNLEKYIEFIRGDVLKFKPREKIDVIIHEQIGNFIWNENLISKVAYIRDNFFKKDGIIIPFLIDLYFVPVNYMSDLEKSIAFWSREKYGIDFSSLSMKVFMQKSQEARYPSIIKLNDRSTFLCTEKLVYTIDVRRETRVPRKIISSFKLKKNSELRGVCLYFKVHLDENNVFSTRPKKANTHWGQLFFPCLEKRMIKRDSVLNFTLFPKREPKKWRFKFEIV